MALLRNTVFWVCVYCLGFLEAVPVGATQLEIARRSLNGYLSSALMIVLGSVLSDAMYGVVAFWGIAPFLRDKTVIVIFWIFGAMVSAALGFWAIREGMANRLPSERSMSLLGKRHIAFVTGFSLAVTNPFMIAYWLIGAHVLTSIGLIQRYSPADTIVFLIVGSLGIGSYLTLLAAAVYKAKRFLSGHVIRRITFAFGVILLLLASYFAVRAGANLGSSGNAPMLIGQKRPLASSIFASTDPRIRKQPSRLRFVPGLGRPAVRFTEMSV